MSTCTKTLAHFPARYSDSEPRSALTTLEADFSSQASPELRRWAFPICRRSAVRIDLDTFHAEPWKSCGKKTEERA